MMNSVKTSLAELTDNTVAADLNSLALIDVTGDDAQAFLQGQLSNDVDTIAHEAGACQLHAYCNPKGRALAVIRLVRHAAGFWMIVPGELADGLVKRLKMYVLRAKVDIALKPEVGLVGLINGDAAAQFGDGVADGITRVPVAGIVPRKILVGDKAVMNSLVRTDGIEAKPNDDLWRLADILSGIPQVYAQTIEAFIPQMINLDLVGGLSFTKGCYPGQEIVARLRYLGKVKQRMIAGVVTETQPPAPGDPIYSSQRPEQKAGTVVDAVPTGDGEYTLSATAPATIAETETLLVGSPEGPALTGISLPYSASAEKPA